MGLAGKYIQMRPSRMEPRGEFVSECMRSVLFHLSWEVFLGNFLFSNFTLPAAINEVMIT